MCVCCFEKEAFHIFACCSDCCIDLLSFLEKCAKAGGDAEYIISDPCNKESYVAAMAKFRLQPLPLYWMASGTASTRWRIIATVMLQASTHHRDLRGHQGASLVVKAAGED